MSINRGRHENYSYSVSERMGYDLVMSLALFNQTHAQTGKGWFPKTHLAHDKLLSWCYIQPIDEKTQTGEDKFTLTRIGAGFAWAFAAEPKFRQRLQAQLLQWLYFPHNI